MAGKWRLKVFIILALSFSTVHSYIDGLYCGLENCYDILGVTRDTPRADIVRSYRQLARKWHPDKHKDEMKVEATEMFRKVANAYEILKDDEQRTDYDYMLDHPDEYLANYYRYYRRRYAPKIDPRIVIAVTITVISVVQYWGAWNNYNTAISYLCKETRYRSKAMDIAKAEGLLNTNKKKGRRNKEEMRNEEEAIIRKVIEEKMDIRGGYSRPSYQDILWIQIVLLPYYIIQYIRWWCSWIWRFWIKREEYGDEEKFYIIKKYMKCDRQQWEAISDEEREDFLHEELWIKENFEVWKQKKDDETKAKLAESARYKSYRRYLKKGGAGQMTFGPE